MNIHISRPGDPVPPVGERPFDEVVGKVLALARLQDLLAWPGDPETSACLRDKHLP